MSRRAAFQNLLDNLWKVLARAWTAAAFARMIRINVQPKLFPGMAAGPDAKDKLHSHVRSLLPPEAECSAPHGSPSAGRNAQRRAGVPTNGGLSVLSAC